MSDIKKVYFYISAVVFTIVAIAHLLRVVFGWRVRLGSVDIPLWISLPLLLFAGGLAYHGWRLSQSTEDVIGETEQQKNLSKLMEIFNGGQEVTNDVVQMLLGVSDATATRYLDRLEKEGLVRQVGDTGSGVRYEKINK